MPHLCTSSPSFVASFTDIEYWEFQQIVLAHRDVVGGSLEIVWWMEELSLIIDHPVTGRWNHEPESSTYKQYINFFQCHFSGVLPDVPWGIADHDPDDGGIGGDDEDDPDPKLVAPDHDYGELLDLGDLVTGVSIQGALEAPAGTLPRAKVRKQDFRTLGSNELEELADLIERGG